MENNPQRSVYARPSAKLQKIYAFQTTTFNKYSGRFYKSKFYKN